MEFAADAEVILTGGDAEHFAGLGGWQTFADPNLVLRGGALLLKESKT
jgi:pantothenate kinase type III